MGLNKNYLIISAIFFNLTGLGSLGRATGTVGGGGGHESEVFVKGAIEKSPKILHNMPKKAKEELNFDPTELLVYIGEIKVLCATDKSLEPTGYNQKSFLDLGKQAYVFDKPIAVQKTIYIDCVKNDTSYWEEKADLSQAGNIVFFIHEIIRTIPSLNKREGSSYFLSRSIFNAKQVEDELVTKAVASLFNIEFNYRDESDSNKRLCKISIEKKTGRDSWGSIYTHERIYFVQLNRGQLYNDLFINLRGDIHDRIITDNGAYGTGGRKVDRAFLYQYMKINKCSNLDSIDQ